MPNYRPIKTNLWDDDYIYELDSEEKLLFIFMITNQRVNLCGIYRVSIGYIYRMTRVSKEKIYKTLIKFEEDNKMKLIGGGEWVTIKNYIKHHTSSPTITEGIKREIAEIPQEIANQAYPIHRVGINYTKLNLTKEKEKEKEKENKNCSYCFKSKENGHEEWCQLYNSKK